MVDTERLRQMIQARGLTLTELAHRAGIDPASMSRIARGADARASSLAKIAGALDTSVDYLLGRESPEPKDSTLLPELQAVLARMDDEAQRELLDFARWKVSTFPLGDELRRVSVAV